MRKILLLMLSVTAAGMLMAQFKTVANKSTVQFSIKNFGINVTGEFAGPEGVIAFEPQHPEKASFNVNVGAGTINTGNNLRDSHLKKEDYFDVEHYPSISFISTRVALSSAKGSFIVYGTLSIKNHQKEIAILFTATPAADGFLFKGQCSINRKDFDIGGSSIIGDTAVISLAVLATK